MSLTIKENDVQVGTGYYMGQSLSNYVGDVIIDFSELNPRKKIVFTGIVNITGNLIFKGDMWVIFDNYTTVSGNMISDFETCNMLICVDLICNGYISIHELTTTSLVSNIAVKCLGDLNITKLESSNSINTNILVGGNLNIYYVANSLTINANIFCDGKVNIAGNVTYVKSITAIGDIIVQGYIQQTHNLVTYKGNINVKTSINCLGNIIVNMVDKFICTSGDLICSGYISVSKQILAPLDFLVYDESYKSLLGDGGGSTTIGGCVDLPGTKGYTTGGGGSVISLFGNVFVNNTIYADQTYAYQQIDTNNIGLEPILLTTSTHVPQLYDQYTSIFTSVTTIPSYTIASGHYSYYNNGVIYMSSSTGNDIFFKNDNNTWNKIEGYYANTNPLVMKNDITYIGEGTNVTVGNYKQSNCTTWTWTDVPLDTHAGRLTTSIATDATFNTILIASKGNNALHISKDKGLTWTCLDNLTGISTSGWGQVRTNANSAQYIMYASTSWTIKLLLSKDYGKTFTTLSTQFATASRISNDGKYMAYSVQNGAVSYFNQLWYSIDFGKNFTVASFQGLIVACSDDHQVCICKKGIDNTLWISKNNLSTFTQIPTNGLVKTVYMNPYSKVMFMFVDQTNAVKKVSIYDLSIVTVAVPSTTDASFTTYLF